MTRERKAQVLAVLALVGAFAAAALRKPTAPAPALGPKDTVYAAFDAARRGDVQAYLDAHSGGMEAALRKSMAESGQAAFSSYLKQSHEAVRGLALQDPVMAPENAATLRVEYIYSDRNEVQLVHLEKTGGRWRIHRVDNSERKPALVPYGTPVQ